MLLLGCTDEQTSVLVLEDTVTEMTLKGTLSALVGHGVGLRSGKHITPGLPQPSTGKKTILGLEVSISGRDKR